MEMRIALIGVLLFLVVDVLAACGTHPSNCNLNALCYCYYTQYCSISDPDGTSQSGPCSACPGQSQVGVDYGSYDESACQFCAAGYFRKDQKGPGGSANCNACPQDTISEDSNCASSCTACPSGAGTTAVASVTCNTCLPGNQGTPPNGCAPCLAGTWSNVRNTSCFSCPVNTTTVGVGKTSPWSCGCTAGNYWVGNLVCAPCPAGSIAPGFNTTRCLQCSPGSTTAPFDRLRCTCMPGYYQSGISCVLCPQGSFQDQLVNITGCQICSSGMTTIGLGANSSAACQCAAGQGGTSGNCVDCGPGRYKGFGFGNCLSCGLGNSTTGTTSSSAANCFACPIGTYQNLTTGGPCIPCPAGTNNSHAGSTMCLCDAGQMIIGGSCQLCPLNYYQPSMAVTPCLLCGAGAQTVPYAAGAKTCQNCSLGYFQSSPLGQACQQCPAGTNNSRAGAVDCLCEPGQGVYGGSCVVCPVNTYQPNRSNGTCQPCSAGSQSGQGATACTSCLQGTYSEGPGLGCVRCPGYSTTQNNGSLGLISCTCAPGNGSFDTTNCTSCPYGSYRGGYGRLGCTPCGAGYTTARMSSVAIDNCFQCPNNTFQPSPSGTCQNCPVNSVFNLTGATDIYNCSCLPGFTRTDPNTCYSCDTGFYKNTTSNLNCTACPPFVTTLGSQSVNASQCNQCVDTPQAPRWGPTCASCNCTTGSCLRGFSQLCGCSCFNNSGFTGPTCSNCSSGWWGPACDKRCYCDKGTCDEGLNGTGICKICNNNGYMMPNCSTCSPGYGGPSCDKCLDGYGQNPDTSDVRNRCVICSPGNYRNASVADPQGQCLPCPPGTFSGNDGSVVCTVCANGDYASGYGNSVCMTCNTPGKFAAPFNSSIGATSCDPCPRGMYQDQVPATGCKSCAPATYGPDLGMQICTNCPPGMAQNRTGQTICLTCPAGQSSPGAVANCTTCGAGTFSPVANASQCTQCDLGFVQPLTGQTGCTACQPGNYSLPMRGQTACRICDAGTYTPDTNYTQCINCSLGFVQGLPGKTSCTACDAGYFAFPVTGQTGCHICPAGSYTPDSNYTKCIDCELGFVQALPGQTSCTACQPGNFSAPTPGQTVCQICDPGSFTPGTNYTYCIGCAMGTYQPYAMSSGCPQCDPGSVQPSVNSTGCNTCQHNEWQDGKGAFVCNTCNPGYTAGVDGSTAATACQACNTTSYLPTGVRDCISCPNTQVTQAPASTTAISCGCLAGTGWDGVYCHPCDPGYVQVSFGVAPCGPCTYGHYYISGDQNCADCPIGGVCTGLAAPPIAGDGWWHDPTLGQYGYIQCHPAGVCANNSQCREGHTGDRCATCLPGWYKNEQTLYCYTCPPAVPLIIAALFILCIILSAILVRLALKNAYIFACATVGFNFLQAIAVLPSFNVKWPAFVNDFFNIVTVLNLDLHIFTPECMVRNGVGAYYYVFALKLLSPFLFALMIAFIFLCVCGLYLYRKKRPADKNTCVGRWFPNISEHELVRFRHAHMNAYLSILIFLYLMLASTALEIYPCDHGLDGRYTMHRDPILYCYESEWFNLVAVSTVSIAVYVVGLPVLLLIVLIRRRRNLHKDKNIVRLGMLYLRYRSQQYFFELCVLLRKFGILSGKILFGTQPMGQVVVAFLTLFIATVVQYRYKPYRSPRVNRLEALHLTCATFVLFLGVLFLALTNSLSIGAQDLMGSLIVAIVSLNILAIFIAVFLELRYNQRLTKHGVTGRFASDRIDVAPQFFSWGVRLVRQSQSQFSAVGLGNIADLQNFDSRSTLVTLSITSERPLTIRAQLASADLAPKPVAPAGSSCWIRFTTYCRSLVLRTLEGTPADQIVDTTPDGLTHTITMAAKDAGLYEAIVYAMPTDGKYEPPVPHGPLTSRFLRCFDSGYDRKLVRTEKIQAFASGGAQVLATLNLTVAGRWTSADYDSSFESFRSSVSSVNGNPFNPGGAPGDRGSTANLGSLTGANMNPVFASSNSAGGPAMAASLGGADNLASMSSMTGSMNFSSTRVGGGLFAVELQPLGTARANSVAE